MKNAVVNFVISWEKCKKGIGMARVYHLKDFKRKPQTPLEKPRGTAKMFYFSFYTLPSGDSLFEQKPVILSYEQSKTKTEDKTSNDS